MRGKTTKSLMLATGFFLLATTNLYSQGHEMYEWAWTHGSNTVNQAGNYGIKDVPSASNTVRVGSVIS